MYLACDTGTLTLLFTMRFEPPGVCTRTGGSYRHHAMLAEAEPAPPITIGDLEINPAERRVRLGGAEIHLTPTEFDLLAHLAGRPRTVLPRERLLAEVWGWADASGTRTVDSHIKALRRKLGADVIRTVHGVGYSLEVSR